MPEPSTAAVDTTDPLATLHAQMEDMMSRSSTRVAFALASPGNRRSTAKGGYDFNAFDRMVRSASYAPLLAKGGTYELLNHRSVGNQFAAVVSVTLPDGSTRKFEFGMSLQSPGIEDTHPSLEPYQLHRGHAPCWRTDRVMPSRY